MGEVAAHNRERVWQGLREVQSSGFNGMEGTSVHGRHGAIWRGYWCYSRGNRKIAAKEQEIVCNFTTV